VFVAPVGSLESLAVPDPGKILVNCAYCFVWKFSCDIATPLRVPPARVTWQLWNCHCLESQSYLVHILWVLL